MRWGFIFGSLSKSPEEKHIEKTTSQFALKRADATHSRPTGFLRPTRTGARGRTISDASSISSLSSYESDLAAGLSSPTFNLNENIERGDEREGLDEMAKDAVLDIMRECSLPFDEARKVYMDQIFKLNCIGPDGMPDDPKLVCFSRPGSRE